MQTLDISAIIVGYNFVIGVLIMLSSEKVGVFAGSINRVHRESIARVTRLSTFTFGAAVAVLSAGIFILFHTMRIGV